MNCAHMAALLFELDHRTEEDQARAQEKELMEKLRKMNEELIPEEAQEERYQYFDTASIRKSLQLNPFAVKKGYELIQNDEIAITEVSTGYVGRNETEMEKAFLSKVREKVAILHFL